MQTRDFSPIVPKSKIGNNNKIKENAHDMLFILERLKRNNYAFVSIDDQKNIDEIIRESHTI